MPGEAVPQTPLPGAESASYIRPDHLQYGPAVLPASMLQHRCAHRSPPCDASHALLDLSFLAFDAGNSS